MGSSSHFPNQRHRHRLLHPLQVQKVSHVMLKSPAQTDGAGIKQHLSVVFITDMTVVQFLGPQILMTPVITQLLYSLVNQSILTYIPKSIETLKLCKTIIFHAYLIHSECYTP